MTLAIIQARLGSSRLPHKALRELAGKPLIQHVIERATLIRYVDRLVVAAPNRRDVDAMMTACLGGPSVEFWCDERVREADVLGRFARCAEWARANTVVRITGDCPLLDPEISSAVLNLYHSHPSIEYAWNVAEGYQDGTDTEVFSRSVLRWANREASKPEDREHVGNWMRRHVKVATLPALVKGLPQTSIDTPADFERVRQMIEGH